MTNINVPEDIARLIADILAHQDKEKKETTAEEQDILYIEDMLYEELDIVKEEDCWKIEI